jgi:large subunit ribosomal protein L4e
MAAARPQVSVFKVEDKNVTATEQVKLPDVLLSPIRPDIVRFVHTSMAKNRRQPYAVSAGAGHQHSAESWGTGRAVARIPRVSGGGTSRAGQGAFGNMCRGGRMFAPTKTWRKWHRKINVNQKRYAVASSLAASALPALVMARGHLINEVPEVPLVVDDSVEGVQKTKQAIVVLRGLAAYSDVVKARDSRKLRAGKGKLRNRRHVNRRGPLVVYNEDNGVTKAFRNLPGVDLCHVDRLNLLQLAPGGHMGRFIIWTKSAFGRLDQIFGSVTRPSVQKTGYTLPRAPMVQSDLTRLINSDEIQSKVRPSVKSRRRVSQKKNPLTNLGALVTLNPYALPLRRAELLAQERRAAARTAVVEARRKGQKVEKTPEAKAKKAAAKKHGANKSKNYARITAGGQGSRLWQPPVKIDKKELEAKALEKAAQDKKIADEAAKKAPKAPAPAKPAAAPAKPAEKKGKEEKPKEEKKGKEEKPKEEKKGKEEKPKAEKGGDKAEKGDKGGKGGKKGKE